MLILGAKRSGLPSGPSLTGSAFLVSVPGMVCPTLWAETRAAAAMTATAMNTVRIGDIADGRGRTGGWMVGEGLSRGARSASSI